MLQMKATIIGLTLIFVCLNAGNVEDLIKTWRGLGWKNVVLLDNNSFNQSEIVQLFKASSDFEVRLQRRVRPLLKDTVSSIVIVGQEWHILMDNLTAVALNRRPYSVMLVTKQLSDEGQFVRTLSALNHSLGFFRYDLSSSERLDRILTFKHAKHSAITQWFRDPVTGLFKEDYRMNGAPLKTSVLSWMPYLRAWNCVNFTRCQAEGVNVDVTKGIGDIFDFDVDIEVDPDGFWGSLPISGTWLDEDAEFGGVLGAVVNKDVDMSIASWKVTYERSLWLDSTTSFIPNKLLLVTNALQHPLDYYLFFKPFQPESWRGCLYMSLGLLLFLVVPHRTIKGFSEDWISWKTIVLSAWIFFVLTEGFFTGAMTMFFSSPKPIPFTTLQQGLKLYPKWNMIIMSGLDLNLRIKAEQGDKFIMEYVSRLDSGLENLIFTDIVSALEKLRVPGTFLMVPEAVLMSAPPVKGVEIQVLGIADKGENSMIFPKHSPLRKIFEDGINRLRLIGAIDAVRGDWQRRFPKPSLLAKQSIDISQTIAAFILYFVSGCVAALVILVEILSSKLAQRNELQRKFGLSRPKASGQTKVPRRRKIITARSQVLSMIA